jgi:hypothetical protein
VVGNAAAGIAGLGAQLGLGSQDLVVMEAGGYELRSTACSASAAPGSPSRTPHGCATSPAPVAASLLVSLSEAARRGASSRALVCAPPAANQAAAA